MYNFLFLFLIFWIFSFIGWIIETILMSIIDKKIVSRGFLVGPYCPVYGIGALAMMIFLKKYLDDPIIIFSMAVIITSIIEYLTSYIMEKAFNARWWDYTNYLFNINGRICLINSVGFGVLGLLLLYVIEPFTVKLLNLLPNTLLIIISSILLVIFLIDLIISFNVVFKIKGSLKFVKKDNTEEINKKVRKVIKNNILAKRIFKAFPQFKPLNIDIDFKKILGKNKKS